MRAVRGTEGLPRLPSAETGPAALNCLESAFVLKGGRAGRRRAGPPRSSVACASTGTPAAWRPSRASLPAGRRRSSSQPVATGQRVAGLPAASAERRPLPVAAAETGAALAEGRRGGGGPGGGPGWNSGDAFWGGAGPGEPGGGGDEEEEETERGASPLGRAGGGARVWGGSAGRQAMGSPGSASPRWCGSWAGWAGTPAPPSSAPSAGCPPPSVRPAPPRAPTAPAPPDASSSQRLRAGGGAGGESWCALPDYRVRPASPLHLLDLALAALARAFRVGLELHEEGVRVSLAALGVELELELCLPGLPAAAAAAARALDLLAAAAALSLRLPLALAGALGVLLAPPPGRRRAPWRGSSGPSWEPSRPCPRPLCGAACAPLRAALRFFGVGPRGPPDVAAWIVGRPPAPAGRVPPFGPFGHAARPRRDAATAEDRVARAVACVAEFLADPRRDCAGPPPFSAGMGAASAAANRLRLAFLLRTSPPPPPPPPAGARAPPPAPGRGEVDVDAGARLVTAGDVAALLAELRRPRPGAAAPPRVRRLAAHFADAAALAAALRAPASRSSSSRPAPAPPPSTASAPATRPRRAGGGGWGRAGPAAGAGAGAGGGGAGEPPRADAPPALPSRGPFSARGWYRVKEQLELVRLIASGSFSCPILSRKTQSVLFYGPPGTGKTTLARIFASELRANFLALPPSSINSKWVGESEKKIRAAFAVARRNTPIVLFIDEIETMLSSRSAGDGSNIATVHRFVQTELLQLWEEERGKRFIIIGATNRPQDIDEAFLRRFDRKILVHLPTFEDRKAILSACLQGQGSLTPGDLDHVASCLENYTGAGIKGVVEKARELQLLEQLKRVRASASAESPIRLELEDEEGDLDEAPAPFDWRKQPSAPARAAAVATPRRAGAQARPGAWLSESDPFDLPPITREELVRATEEVRPSFHPASPEARGMAAWAARHGSRADSDRLRETSGPPEAPAPAPPGKGDGALFARACSPGLPLALNSGDLRSLVTQIMAGAGLSAELWPIPESKPFL
eukprot:tig00020930_g16032.t1